MSKKTQKNEYCSAYWLYQRNTRGHPMTHMIGLAVLLIVMLLTAQTLYAGEPKGTVEIVYLDESNAVQGAVFQLFHIAVINQITDTAEADLSSQGPVSAQTGLRFQSLVPGLDLSVLEQGEGITSLSMAQKMAETCEEAVDKQMSAGSSSSYKGMGYEGKTDQNGILKIEGVNPGLYLVREITPAEGYQRSVSFLISVPMMDRSEWLYEVRAEPKPEKMTETETTSITENDKQQEPQSETRKTNNGQEGHSIADGSSEGKAGGTGTNVKTGDTSMPVMYISLLLLSICILISLIRYRYKHFY